MPAKQRFRKRAHIDLRIQGALIVRVVIYWLTCLLAMIILMLGWDLITVPTRPLSEQLRSLWALFAPAAIASLVLLPAVIFDLVSLSNRVAGPMIRIRRSMHDLAQGNPVAALRFRQSDFWQEFGDDFNTVAQKIKDQPPPSIDEFLLVPDEPLLARADAAFRV